jgi:peroxiredoxin
MPIRRQARHFGALLSDMDGRSVPIRCLPYREHQGHKKLTVVRSTFIIDKQGIVRHALYDVTPKGHAAEIFKLVKGLNHSCK